MPPLLLLTGRPGIGKTTAVRRALERLRIPVAGFYTEEVREKGRRIGFKVVSLDGEEGWLARVGGRGPRVGRYAVDVRSFDAVAIPALDPLRHPEARLWVIDEVGRMEIFSWRFRKAVEALLQDPRPLLATIPLKELRLTRRLRRHPLATVWEVTEANRDELPDRIVEWVEMVVGE